MAGVAAVVGCNGVQSGAEYGGCEAGLTTTIQSSGSDDVRAIFKCDGSGRSGDASADRRAERHQIPKVRGILVRANGSGRRTHSAVGKQRSKRSVGQAGCREIPDINARSEAAR